MTIISTSTFFPAGCHEKGAGLPVDDEMFVWGLLVADRTDPGGLLLVHLDVERGVEALQVGARERAARDRQPHLPQLRREQSPERTHSRDKGIRGGTTNPHAPHQNIRRAKEGGREEDRWIMSRNERQVGTK